jgi:hypothetical protein
MKKEEIAQLSTEELIKKTETQKKAAITFAVLYGLIGIIGLVTAFMGKQFTTSLIMVACFLPLLIVNFKTLKMLQEELKGRGQ